MQFDAEKILTIIQKELAENEKNAAIIYWDETLLEAGDTIKAGNQPIEMPFKVYMVFIDLEPKANWGHATYYGLIDINTSAIKLVKREFPPYSGNAPPSYKVLLRYGKKPPHDRYFNVFE